MLIYTTRPDTPVRGNSMVIAPEHPAIEKWADRIRNIDEVKAYQAEAAKKSDFGTFGARKEKTGVKLDGVSAINPVNGKEIPIFISDYVIISYGTGAIMAVPAHDERDWILHVHLMRNYRSGQGRRCGESCVYGLRTESW